MRPIVTAIPLQHLASGDRLTLQVYRFAGTHPGKKVYIQSNLHGSEIAGNAVIHHLLNWLQRIPAEQVQGEIVLVPMCNPTGVNQRSFHFSSGRFNPYDGRDWNRIFWEYEDQNPDVLEFAQTHLERSPTDIQIAYRQMLGEALHQWGDRRRSSAGMSSSDRLAYTLQSLAWDADYVIDLHSSSDRGLPYLYYFQGRDESAKLFQFNLSILLNDYDGNAFDEAFIKPWLALETCLHSLGRSLQFDIAAWTLELGTSMELNPDAVAQGIHGVKHYLVHNGVVQDAQVTSIQPTTPPYFTTRQQMKRYFAPVGGMVEWRSPVGTVVQTGQPLYRLLSFNKTGELPTLVDVCAEQAGFVLDVSINHAVNEGEYVMYVIEESTDL